MSEDQVDLAIINRSFWPIYPVLGEALLRLAEGAVEGKNVCVIMQDHADIRTRLDEEGRGKGVIFYPCKAWTTSASSFVMRVFDAFYFMLWVAYSLVKARPKRIYVSTDPPVAVPFVVMLYAKVFRTPYIYHLQDIHPEATNVIIPINKWLYSLLRYLDSMVMRNASTLITITQEMKALIVERSGAKSDVYLLDNPAVSFDKVDLNKRKKKGFTFCGNAGRLQKIPLLIDAIDLYIRDGGDLDFVFAGGGVYADLLASFAEKHPNNVCYLGNVSAAEAAQLNADYEWALLPIEDEVTRYAFPSKTSSYVFSGAKIAAICGAHTSVGRWVVENNLGVCVESSVEALVSMFKSVEAGAIGNAEFDACRASLKSRLNFDFFVSKLHELLLHE